MAFKLASEVSNKLGADLNMVKSQMTGGKIPVEIAPGVANLKGKLPHPKTLKNILGAKNIPKEFLKDFNPETATPRDLATFVVQGNINKHAQEYIDKYQVHGIVPEMSKEQYKQTIERVEDIILLFSSSLFILTTCLILSAIIGI